MYLTINKKLFILIITVLSILVVGSLGFIVYDKLIKAAEEEKEYITVIDDASIDVNKLYEIGEILDNFDKAFGTSDSKYLGYVYNNKVLEARDFDKNAAIYASIYPNLIRSNTEQTISNARIKSRYEKIFGKALEYKPASLDLGNNIKVTYDETNKTYKYTASITNNDHKGEYLVRNMKTTLKDDLVIVTRKVFYVEYSNNSAIIYTNSSKGTKLGSVSLKNGEVSLKEVTGKFGSKLNTYDFTFKLGSDDEYTFNKIQRTK